MAPVTTQTSSSAPGPHCPTWRPMSADTMKMPEPIIEPTTREMAASGPIPRMNSVGADVVGEASLTVAMRQSDPRWEGTAPGTGRAGARRRAQLPVLVSWGGGLPVLGSGMAGLDADSAAFTA